MSRICLLCQTNETLEGTQNKVCTTCYDNGSYLLETYAEEIAELIKNDNGGCPICNGGTGPACQSHF